MNAHFLIFTFKSEIQQPVYAGLFTGHRAMQIVPPMERYRSWYTFSTEQGDILSNFTHYVLVVGQRSAVDRLLIDGQPIDNTTVQWVSFDASSTGSPTDVVGGAIQVKSAVHIILQQDGVPFGAYVFGFSSTYRCMYAYPAGLCLGTGSAVGLFFVKYAFR